MFLPRAGGSIRTRNSRRSIPPTSCLSAAELLSALEKVIARRVGTKSIGFVATGRERCAARRGINAARRDVDLLAQCQPVDLIKYGFIPEFIGRMPVTAVLEDLSKEALVQILTKPKNAIIRQYQKLFEFENVKLKFSDEALGSRRAACHGAQSGRARSTHDSGRSDAGPDVLSPDI